MPTTHTTEKFTPYMQRPLSLAKFIDESHFYMNLIKDHFPDHDAYMFYLVHRDKLKKFFEELRIEYDQSPQFLAALRLKQFYHEVFDRTIAIPQTAIKALASGRSRLMYIPGHLSNQQVIEVITKKYFPITFSDDAKSCLNKAEKPGLGYYFLWEGYTEHNREYSGMRLDAMNESPHKYMNMLEYLLTSLFRYWLTGRKLDETGCTLLDTETESKKSVIVSSQLSHCVFTSIARDEKSSHPPAGPRRIDIVN